MNKIQSFKNAQEFQELFGIQEHNNGVKSRRNKILLALLKSKSVWAYCRERDDWSLLAIKSMAPRIIRTPTRLMPTMVFPRMVQSLLSVTSTTTTTMEFSR